MKRRERLLFIICIIQIILISACGKSSISQEERTFAETFGLAGYEKDISLQEMSDNYGGFPYEGIAFYEVTINEANMLDLFHDMNDLPYDDSTLSFIESVSEYAAVPAVESGWYEFVNRSSDEKHITNASLFVYDSDNNIGYYVVMDT